MTHGTARTGVSRLHATTPDGWVQRADGSGDGRIALGGPRDAHGVRPRVEIWAQLFGFDGIEAASRAVLDSLRQDRPGALVASCDVWPHPRWGEGRQFQTAFIVDGAVVAHDRYIFLDGGVMITLSIDCLLQDLLRWEETVARIVSSVRWAEAR
ncbi:MAG TPA: hypothetical protein VES01_10260 [Dermatophilaceae bacterium]|nr:hypothetical protein [Dermatophilaceae bacterium]